MNSVKELMIVDDDQISNFLTEMLIKEVSDSTSVVFCENGGDALEHLKQCFEKDSNCPELIFLDVNMPVMDGFDFLSRLREINGRHIPVVMLTASINPKEFEKANNEYGVVSFLEKPLTKTKLQIALDKVLPV